MAACSNGIAKRKSALPTPPPGCAGTIPGTSAAAPCKGQSSGVLMPLRERTIEQGTQNDKNYLVRHAFIRAAVFFPDELID